MLYLIVIVFGLLIGSFLNVCIFRIPEGVSIVTPASKCPGCGTPIKFYDNIPIISYLLLMGKCRNCRAKVSARYPFVEFLNAALYAVVLNRFGVEPPWVLFIYLFFTSVLIVIFFIDLDHQIIPNSITYPGIPIAVLLGATVLPDPFLRYSFLGYKAAIIGLIVGGGFFYLVAVAGKVIFKKDAMGGGDIKMMAMVGGLLGWKGVILTTFAGSLLGSIVGVTLIRLKGREWGSKIAFGPYLALGALISMLWGEEILRWYLY
jgi:leader peptidase (prepilin peptidase)/N-methyltransferase